MAHRKTLTQAQLDLLDWIDEGCPEGVMEGESHRISAAALRRRGLVQVSGRGRSWEAQITAAGREHLEAVKEPGAPAPRQANVSVTEELIREVIEERHRLPEKEDRNAEQERLHGFLKVFANAASYGIYAEMNRIEQPAGRKVGVPVYGCADQPVRRFGSVHPSTQGELAFAPPAATITAGARCVLDDIVQQASHE